MRLLHTHKEGLVFEDFYGEDVPSYAILSHTWYSTNEEVSYQDICDGKGQDRPGYEKVLRCKSLASDYDYFWIDTCCIDKKSSAELSEAINSMYLWYENSAVCYAYLSDVLFADPIDTEAFKKSRWFTRGWTLQELIAPATVVFFSKEWKKMSRKGSLLDVISDITAIPDKILSGQASPARYSVAERMSWASNRTTTRIEDEAYSLMGLFGVNMPLLYGEKGKAFHRLQEEIMKRTEDQSIFSWTLPEVMERQYTGLLAERPRLFARSQGIQSMGIWAKGSIVGVTNRGVRAKMYLVPKEGYKYRGFIAALDCWSNSHRDHVVTIILQRLARGSTSFDLGHKTPFVRLHITNRLEIESSKNLVGGEYRDICVQEMAFTAKRLDLSVYNILGKYIRIQHLGRFFSVRPVGSWEPQTDVFTVPHQNRGPLGAICVPSDGCEYIAHFGRNKSGGIWVFSDLKTTKINRDVDEIWKHLQRTGKEETRSEISYRASRQPNSHAERFVVEVKRINFFLARIYEISFVVSRIAPEEVNVQDGEISVPQ